MVEVQILQEQMSARTPYKYRNATTLDFFVFSLRQKAFKFFHSPKLALLIAVLFL